MRTFCFLVLFVACADLGLAQTAVQPVPYRNAGNGPNHVDPAAPAARPSPEFEELEGDTKKAAAAVADARADISKPKWTNTKLKSDALPQVKVDAYVVKYSPSKLAKVGSLKYGGKQGQSLLKFFHQKADAAAKKSPAADLLKLLNAMRDDQLLEITTSASVVATAGMTSKYHVGGEYNYRRKDAQGKEVPGKVEYGTWLEVEPIGIATELLLLRCRLEVKEFEADAKMRVGENEWAPIEDSTEAYTTISLLPGHIVSLGGSRWRTCNSEKGKDGRDTQHFEDGTDEFYLTATIVQKDNAKAAKDVDLAPNARLR